MLTHPIFEKLKTLKLQGMCQALEVQMGNSEYQKLAFEERLGLLVDNEITEQEGKRLQTRLKTAKFRQNACMQDIDYRSSRGLDKSLMCSLESCGWVSKHRNVLIIGPTGTGKTFIAEALGHQACLRGHTSKNIRLPTLFSELIVSKADGSYFKLMSSMSKYDVLILDDLGIAPLTDEQRRDLLEIIDARYNQKATIITSQLPIKIWHEAIGDSTLADAIMDRIVHNAYRIELKGDSMRKKAAQQDEK